MPSQSLFLRPCPSASACPSSGGQPLFSSCPWLSRVTYWPRAGSSRTKCQKRNTCGCWGWNWRLEHSRVLSRRPGLCSASVTKSSGASWRVSGTAHFTGGDHTRGHCGTWTQTPRLFLWVLLKGTAAVLPSVLTLAGFPPQGCRRAQLASARSVSFRRAGLSRRLPGQRPPSAPHTAPQFVISYKWTYKVSYCCTFTKLASFY